MMDWVAELAMGMPSGWCMWWGGPRCRGWGEDMLPGSTPPGLGRCGGAGPTGRATPVAAARAIRELCTLCGGVLGCRPQEHLICLPPSTCNGAGEERGAAGRAAAGY